MGKKRVVIALSGGVDSSVTAALLKKQGYECIGVHLQFWVDPTGPSAELARNKCCTLQGLEDARHIARQLDIPFYVINAVDEFKERVVDYFLDTYAHGETPNPCIPCNRSIKFGSLLRRAMELHADYIATGHYARIMPSKTDPGKLELWTSRDTSKDQSYFLYHLTQEKLGRILFPLGDLLKSVVYELAEEFGLERVAGKPESQGLCFFSDRKPTNFLGRYLSPDLFVPGPIVKKDGTVIGTHKGLPLYTIGQRQGLGIGGIHGEPEGDPWYVIEKDIRQNRLIVSHKEDISETSFVCGNPEFISGGIPGSPIEVNIRIRHRGERTPAVLEAEEGKCVVTLRKPLPGISGGQSVVFYEGEKVLGGGIIESAFPTSKYEKENSLQERTGVPVAY